MAEYNGLRLGLTAVATFWSHHYMQVAEQGKTRLDGIFRKLITVGSTYSRDCTELEGGGRQAISGSDWLASAGKPVDSRPQLVHCNKLDHCGQAVRVDYLNWLRLRAL